MMSIRRVFLLLAAVAVPAAAAAQQPAPSPQPSQPPQQQPAKRPTVRPPGEARDTRPWMIHGAPGLAVRNPRFEDFAVASVYRGRPAAVDLSSDPLARRYRTRLRRAAAGGADFAGHYAVATWGCGAACQRFALVDVQTGKAWISPARLVRGVQFRVNSSLFVLDPASETARAHCGTSQANPCPTYLMLRDGRLVPLDSPPAHP